VVSIKKYREVQRNVLIKNVSPVSKISARRGYRLVTRSYDSSCCLNWKLNNQKILIFLRGPQLFATLLTGFKLFFDLESSPSSVRFQTKIGVLWILYPNHVCESIKSADKTLTPSVCSIVLTTHRSPERVNK